MSAEVSSKSIQRPSEGVAEVSSERYLDDKVLGVEMVGDRCCP